MYYCFRFLRNPTELKNIKNISLLRQQMSPTRVAPQTVVKSEMKEERCEDEHVDEDMPTDLSMAASEPWRKRARPDPSSITSQYDKHRISALIGDSMIPKREPEYSADNYALNLKSEKCEQ
jgi:ETS translocation variant 6/7